MPANWENSAVGTGLKRSVFIPIPKKGNAKECSDYQTVLLISHASKVILKILQSRLQQYVNCEIPDVQARFRKGRGTGDALISHASKVILKILQARLQQYVNYELSDDQAGFRKGKGTRDQIATICWIIEKAREFR